MWHLHWRSVAKNASGSKSGCIYLGSLGSKQKQSLLVSPWPISQDKYNHYYCRWHFRKWHLTKVKEPLCSQFYSEFYLLWPRTPSRYMLRDIYGSIACITPTTFVREDIYGSIACITSTTFVREKHEQLRAKNCGY